MWGKRESCAKAYNKIRGHLSLFWGTKKYKYIWTLPDISNNFPRRKFARKNIIKKLKNSL